jgi:PilZ domain-containing protein
MTEKIFLNSDQTATFVCPKCRKTRLVDVSPYLAHKNIIRLRAKCACGHIYKVFIDKRKKFRKQTRLAGTYKYGPNDSLSKKYTGEITIENLSYSGLRIKLQAMPRFKVNDILLVDFLLDDKKKSRIQTKVVVRNIKGFYAGLEYVSQHSLNKELGFYLFQ